MDKRFLAFDSSCCALSKEVPKSWRLKTFKVLLQRKFLLNNKVLTLLGNTVHYFFAYGKRKLPF